MDLFEKFKTVEIKAEGRLSEADREYCERQEAAYHAAVKFHVELLRAWTLLHRTQMDILGSSSVDDNKKYLPNSNLIKIDDDLIRDHISRLHTCFIGAITSHFRRTYAVDIEDHAMRDELPPKKPDWSYDPKDQDAYFPAAAAVIRYADILEDIFKQLDGRSFTEQAEYQMRRKCREAVWKGNVLPTYERRKATIRFTDNFCDYQVTGYGYHTETSWNLSDKMKNIIRGIAHFEAGSCTDCPREMQYLLGDKFYPDERTFTDCRTVAYLKLFKNGRVDIKFTSVLLAEEFAEKYLGRTSLHEEAA